MTQIKDEKITQVFLYVWQPYTHHMSICIVVLKFHEACFLANVPGRGPTAGASLPRRAPSRNAFEVRLENIFANV
jgi:hypothetical protein